MRIFALILWLLSLPAILSAAPFPVVSGEHDGFTRIVAQVPSGSSWEVAQTDGAVTLTLPGHRNGFDTSKVFDRIGRDRIATVKSDSGSLALKLNCTCRVSAFPSGADYAVIDVAAPGVTLSTPFVEPIRSSEPDTDLTSLHGSQIQQTPVPSLLPIIVKAPKQIQPPPTLKLDRTPLSETQQTALNEIQIQLAEELGTATTRGILVPSIRQPPTARSQVDPKAFAPALSPAPLPPAVSQELVSNMRITDSRDRPFGGNNEGVSTTRNGISCPTDSQIAIETWGTPDTFDQQISAGRTALFGEFDRIDSEAALTLARSYLYFGFGAEARQVLNLSPGLARDNRLLLDIADIMDHGRPQWPEMLEAYRECRTDIALWSILAQTEARGATPLPATSALRTLNKLPEHLRRLLAPQLSRRLLAHGNHEAAAAALRSLERLPDGLSGKATLAQAHVELEQGKIDEGTVKLESVVDENVEESPEALIALINTRIKTGQAISVETAELVEAYAQEHRGSPVGVELRRTHFMALVKSGQFDRAFLEIATRTSPSDKENDLALRLYLINELTKSASDIVFLDHVLKHSADDLAHLQSSSKFDLASRLLSLGFAAEAQQLLSTEPEADRPLRRQLLAAEAALALDQPFQAQAALLGIDDPAAAPLRARAKAMSGEYAEAHNLFRELDLEAPAREAAWLAEDWRDRTPSETPVFGPTAELADTKVEASDDPSGMLARSAAALNESIAARDTLANLLAATDLSVEAE